MDELLSLPDDHLASYLKAPAVPEKRDKRYEQLMPLLPSMVKELALPHMTRRVVWEDLKTHLHYIDFLSKEWGTPQFVIILKR